VPVSTNNNRTEPRNTIFGVGSVVILLLCLLSFPVLSETYVTKETTEESPTRVRDLSYGSVLYEYYQGHAFEALSLINVAKHKGGISGHGDHPALVEGGLMLSYGMAQEAKKRFESVLKDQVSASHKNEAWFYLAKIFYLQQAFQSSIEAIRHVDKALLKQDDVGLYHDLVYMEGEISHRTVSMVDKVDETLQHQITLLDERLLLQSYLRYNQVVMLVDDGNIEQAILSLSKLVSDLVVKIDSWGTDENELTELIALKEQCLLSLGQLYLGQSRAQEAFKVIAAIRKGSVFSDQALFSYSVAAANLGEFGLALSALNQLESRPRFSPWLRQVPYATAYLYENLNEPELALEAYRIASKQYQRYSAELDAESQNLTEEKILVALNIEQTIGTQKIQTNAYGKLNVSPADFGIASLLASETFQHDLSELHELYQLKTSLGRWSNQLDSFDEMMTVRNQLREQKIERSVEKLKAQNADQWVVGQVAISNKIDAALDSEDVLFFMGQEQKDYYQRIRRVHDNLADFPEGDQKQQYLEKISRIDSYFSWWVTDTYGVNRWQAQKQSNALSREIEAFTEHRKKLDRVMSSNERNDALAERITSGRQRLTVLGQDLDISLNESRQRLLEQVRTELGVQAAETRTYLLASREAQARLSDALYRKQLNHTEDEMVGKDEVQNNKEATQ